MHVLIHETFAPRLPTLGFVGTFDPGCDQVACEAPIRFGRNYLVVATPHDRPISGRLPESLPCVDQTSDGDRGDIAC